MELSTKGGDVTASVAKRGTGVNGNNLLVSQIGSGDLNYLRSKVRNGAFFESELNRLSQRLVHSFGRKVDFQL